MSNNSFLKSAFCISAGLIAVGIVKLLETKTEKSGPDKKPESVHTTLSTPVSKCFGHVTDSLGKTVSISEDPAKSGFWYATILSLRLDTAFNSERIQDSALFKAQPMTSLIEKLDVFFADQETDQEYQKKYRTVLRPQLYRISQGLSPVAENFSDLMP